MANISLTATCNRACAFCFAADAMDEKHRAGIANIPLERFEEALDFLVRSGIPEARLLGGEPTIHPAFPRLVDRALARGLRLVVFSGGLMPEAALRTLEEVPPDAVAVLLNVLAPDRGKPHERARQQQVLERLGSRVTLGVTIDSPAVDIGFLLEMIPRYGLSPSVRLGLAHPAVDGDNTYLHPRHYAEVGRRVADFGRVARARGITLGFDCGWVPCMFPEGALAELGLTPEDVGLRCNPILDVLPDGHVVSCYPLAAHTREELRPDRDAAWMRARFVEAQEPDRVFTLFRECATCDWRARGECTGGCLAASLRRTRHRAFSVAVGD